MVGGELGSEQRVIDREHEERFSNSPRVWAERGDSDTIFEIINPGPLAPKLRRKSGSLSSLSV